ncbi:MAG: hypothetical protein HY927_08155 [Elusimicrobia bacterium]|nr:hypothetical protein [Elusimicrobiota bacterium]
MRLAILALLLAPAAPGHASEQSTLVSCFQALVEPDDSNRPLSDGPGQNLAVWEWAPPELHTAVAVPGRHRGNEGFFFYGDDTAEFMHFQTRDIPRELRTGAYRVIPLAFTPAGPGRGTFRCEYRALDTPGYRPGLDCGFVDRASRYYPPAKIALAPTSPSLAPLKTAVMQRLLGVHAVYQKRADDYGRSLERHRERMRQGPGALEQLGELAGMDMSWRRQPPTPPVKEAARRALSSCARTEDEYVRSAANAEISLLDAVSLPR